MDSETAGRRAYPQRVQYFLIPLIFGVITGIIGRRKGSSFLLWSLVGFLLPAIGLAAVFMSRNEREDPSRECPNCHKLLPISAQVCMRCGEDLDYPAEFVV
ncbi:MAG: hypothetical protein HY827_09570 [Actinobacteria bacterium]|nr:hypothetical protein [Actinomycetota bacterium]